MAWHMVTGSYRLRVFQIRMLRKIHVFRYKREEVTRDWRKLYARSFMILLLNKL
jgi:hypothetical protein